MAKKSKKKTAKKKAKKVTKKTVKKASKKPVKRKAKKTVARKSAAKKSKVKKSSKKTIRKSSKKAFRKAAKKTVRKAAKKTVRKAAKIMKAIKKKTKKVVKKPVKKTIKKSSAKSLNKFLIPSKPVAPIVRKFFTTKTYLSARELNHFRKLLTEEKNQILENAKRLRDSLVDENTGEYVGDNSTFSMHMAEQGTDEMEREKAYMFIQRDEKYLGYLQEALDRIENKTYGRCVTCGRPIPKLRLEVVPITQHCLNCKQAKSS